MNASTPAVAALLILLCVLAAYGNSVSPGFLVDDALLITDNPLLRQPGNVFKLLKAPFLESYYRPIVLLSFYVDTHLWKLSAPGYHLTNILLHYANALLLFFLIRRLFGRPLPALLTAMLFAVHPIHVIPLNYIADRGNLLAALFSFSCLILIDKAADRTGRQALGLRAAAALAFCLALLSRESAVLLPLFAGLCVTIKRRPVPKGEKFFLAALFLVATAYPLFARNLLPLLAPKTAAFLSGGTLAAFSFTVIRYLGLLIWPDQILWTREIRLTGHETLLYPALLVCLTAWATLAARRSRPVLFAGLWSLAGFLPLFLFMQARPHMGFIMQDNQIYVAAAGPLFLAAWGLTRLLRTVGPRAGWVLIAGLFGLYAGAAHSFNTLYSDPETFLRHWLRHSPHSDAAAANLGVYYQRRGDDERALRYHLLNLTGGRRDAVRFLGAATACQNMKKVAESEMYLNKALALAPDTWQVHNNLGLICWERGDTDHAEAFFRQAAHLEPSSPWPPQNISLLRESQGRRKEAVAAAQEMRRQFPSFRPIGFHLIRWYLEDNLVPEALEEAGRMLETNDQSAATGLVLAGIFYKSGRPQEALLLIGQMQTRHPQEMRAILESGIVAQQGDEINDAVVLWQRAAATTHAK